MDEIDKKLWQELGSNCRNTCKYLGEKLGVSANAAKKRVERLVDSGSIQG
ncbi:MAG: AsnC family transcriptional regulator [Candidatus Thorarchaeota archaeon]